MLGVYDFCGHYEWTFEWLRQQGGETLVQAYWRNAISKDSQRHARKLIEEKGFKGMDEYWGHTLLEEGAGYQATQAPGVFRIDMHDCPSKGFLIQNKLEQYHDYCDHCIGWIRPMMEKAGFQVSHEHNHLGQCWWEFRKAEDQTPPSQKGALSGENDVRHQKIWNQGSIQKFD